MKKFLFLSLVVHFLIIKVNAQININTSNNVGIGTTSPLSKLSVGDPGGTQYEGFFLNPATSGSLSIALGAQALPNGNRCQGLSGFINLNTSANINIGTWGSVWSSTPLSNGRAYGVYGYAGNATSGWNYGVYGQLAGSNNGAAIFGVVPGYGDVNTAGMYAGYFQGNVKVATGVLYTPTGTVTTSDARLKRNITTIDTTDLLFKLKPVKYNLKSLKEQNQVRISISGKNQGPDTTKIINLPDPEYINKIHYGFLAQDVQNVYPNLVYKSEDGTLGIDYQGLIPIIVAELKKTKLLLNDKDAKINDLESRISQLEKLIKK